MIVTVRRVWSTVVCDRAGCGWKMFASTKQAAIEKAKRLRWKVARDGRAVCCVCLDSDKPGAATGGTGT